MMDKEKGLLRPFLCFCNRAGCLQIVNHSDDVGIAGEEFAFGKVDSHGVAPWVRKIFVVYGE